MNGYAVKAIDASGAIEAYAVRWGHAGEPDRSREKDYFTQKTDLMLDAWGWPRPILYEHQPDQVGQWHRATKDSVGVKLAGQLDTSHPRYPQIDRDIRAGRFFLSSDSAPHLVKRIPQWNGTNELARWALLTASLTKSPAEHRLMPVAMVKSLALKADPRVKRIRQDLAWLERERVLDIERDLDRLERQMRIERELKALEA